MHLKLADSISLSGFFQLGMAEIPLETENHKSFPLQVEILSTENGLLFFYYVQAHRPYMTEDIKSEVIRPCGLTNVSGTFSDE